MNGIRCQLPPFFSLYNHIFDPGKKSYPWAVLIWAGALGVILEALNLILDMTEYRYAPGFGWFQYLGAIVFVLLILPALIQAFPDRFKIGFLGICMLVGAAGFAYSAFVRQAFMFQPVRYEWLELEGQLYCIVTERKGSSASAEHNVVCQHLAFVPVLMVESHRTFRNPDHIDTMSENDNFNDGIDSMDIPLSSF